MAIADMDSLVSAIPGLRSVANTATSRTTVDACVCCCCYHCCHGYQRLMTRGVVRVSRCMCVDLSLEGCTQNVNAGYLWW